MIPLRTLSLRRRAATIGRWTSCAVAVVALTSMSAGSVHATTATDVTVSDGTRTLTVSAADGLDPNSQTLRVRGSGYDTTKGIYIGLCVVQPADQQPSPCGGGIDKTGSSGSSVWISSNPPAYGVGLAVPYGDGGSFDAEITVSATVNAAVDCRRVACAIVTKSDHTIIDDRSQDLLIPVTFTGDPPPLAPSTTTAPTDESVSEITVSPNVENLTGVATSNDSGLGWAPIVIGIGVLAGLASIIVVSIRRTSARRGR